MKTFFAFLMLVLLPAAGVLAAETLETLDAALLSVEQRQAAVGRNYSQERRKNEERQLRIAAGKGSSADLHDAYASAATLDALNSQINELSTQHQQLCLRWRAVYRFTVDALLVQADREADPKKKAEIGRRLQYWQKRNQDWCAEVLPAASLEWKSLHIEPYDGPLEIEQKTQLLKDISREMTIRLSRLEDQYQQAQREHRTRERAQEFIQEGTLFDQSINLRSSTSLEAGSDRGSQNPLSTGSELVGGSSGTAVGGNPDDAGAVDWQPGRDPKKMKEEYRKRREDLLSQQKELQNRIREFEDKQKALLKP